MVQHVHVHGPMESKSGTGAQAGVGLEASDRRSLLTQAQAQGAGALLRTILGVGLKV